MVCTITRTITETVTVTTTLAPPGNRVVCVHDTDATHWEGETAFWEHVDQDVVYDMVDRGLLELTGAATVTSAWESLIPNYQAGEIVAIKVNMNNATQCTDVDAQIDALMQPVNGLIRGLLLIGVAESDIWVIDPSKEITNRFVAASAYDDIRYMGELACSDVAATWVSEDANATVTWTGGDPAPPAMRIADIYVTADYLINVPIMKVHASTIGVSLSFKNHFGSIASPDDLHDYIASNGAYYDAGYNPMVDIWKNPHIGAKTVLVMGDGLFGAITLNTSAPETWTTFSNKVPNCLLFSCDPVAIDCVMYDFLDGETARAAASDDYLVLAAAAGLGTFEHGAPLGVGYSTIDYVYVDGV